MPSPNDPHRKRMRARLGGMRAPPRLHELLDQIAATEWSWLERLLERVAKPSEREASFAALDAAFEALSPQERALVEAMAEQDRRYGLDFEREAAALRQQANGAKE